MYCLENRKNHFLYTVRKQAWYFIFCVPSILWFIELPVLNLEQEIFKNKFNFGDFFYINYIVLYLQHLFEYL